MKILRFQIDIIDVALKAGEDEIGANWREYSDGGFMAVRPGAAVFVAGRRVRSKEKA